MLVSFEGTRLAPEPLTISSVQPEVEGAATAEQLSPEPILVGASAAQAPQRASRPPLPCDGVDAADEGARAIYCRALRLAEQGRSDRALDRLAELSQIKPRIRDYIALLEGRLQLTQGSDETACAAFDDAVRSPLRSLQARARVEQVRCLLTVGAPNAEAALSDLRSRYRRLPQSLELKLLAARAREQGGSPEGAVELYREIDLRQPGSAEARQARQQLAALSAEGVSIAPYTIHQRLVRLAKLVRTGPYDIAREEISSLRQERLTRGVLGRIARLDADIARREGRFEDARRLLLEAGRLPGADAEERASQRERAQVLDQASQRDDPERMRRAVNGLIGSGNPLRQPLGRLYQALQLAARAGLTDEVDRTLGAMTQRRNLPPWLSFNAAIAAAGTGDDELVAQLFAVASRNGALEKPARYHRGRCLERLGRAGEARAEYLRVLELDDGDTPFYAFWARQRLPRVEAALDELCGVERDEVPQSEIPGGGAAPPLCPPRLEASAWQLVVDEPAREALSGPEIAERLRPLAEARGEAFPWLLRAVDLLELGERDEAADELHETFLAWSDARGRKQFRTGVESLYRGSYPRRHWPTPAGRRARRTAFGAPELAILTEVSQAVGDHGLAVRFGGWQLADARPRAHEEIVIDAAARHGVDPDLLLAVMRVESVYNRRIISYAGAVGLNQIMPGTGAFIARQLGREDFTVDDLLDPAVNIEFSAWYLASLIERFDGRMALAVAAYNGGPHNVRLWLGQHSPAMSLEAFLETIPFDQTHRYVRRVLTHYEVYRAQRGLTVDAMDLTVPALTADPVAF